MKTRWRSTHGMTDSLRVNQEPLLLYEVRKEKVAEGFKNNRLSLEDWSIPMRQCGSRGTVSC